MDDMEALVTERDSKAKAKSKTWYDRGMMEDPLEVGDAVLCMLPVGDGGLTAKWEGPYKVLEVLGPVTYLINKPTHGRKGRRVHRNALKRYIFHVALAHVISAEDDYRQTDKMMLGPEIPHTNELESEGNETKWTEATSVEGLSDQQQKQLEEELRSFEDVFSDLPGNAKLPPFRIETGQAPPISAKPYTIPLLYWDKAKAELQNMQDLGIIEDSTSPWSSPVICVPKPNNGLRLCMDYRKLNGVTTTDVYPLPNIEHLIQKIATSKFISTMDLTRGYYQVPLDPQHRHKTAFVSPFGKWQFTRMPFGVKNAPAWFQRHMDQILKEHENADAYIDDICVYSNTWKDHLTHLREVLQCLREVGLTVRLAKCSFARSRVQYLGHLIGGGTIAPVDAKIQAISTMEQPVDKKGLRRFLGMASYYRRFIPSFADVAAVLHAATSKKENNRIRWTLERQQAFAKLQEAVTATVTLYAPDQTRPYILKTDASGTGIGAALEQEKDGQNYPVAFFSRKLTGPETRYGVTELEALAIVEAVKHFEVYLRGARFTVETDHKALSFLQSMKRGSPKLMRWAALLQEHDCQFIYKPGQENVVADALSRMFDGEEIGDSQSRLEVKSLLDNTAKPPEVGGDVMASPDCLEEPSGWATPRSRRED